MSNYVDQKITIWTRYDFPDDVDMNHVLKLVRTGISMDKIVEDELGLGYGQDVHYSIIDETEGELTIAENDSQPTIEVYNNDKLIGTNE